MNCKRITIWLFFIAGLAAVSGFISAGDPIIQKVIQQLDKWLLIRPTEKVYLQLDKPYYTSGDDVWFKAYTVSGAKHQLSELSGVLNVELINKAGTIQQHIKLPLTSGLTWGALSLPDTLLEGNYRIRAYTNYMRNAGESYFFDRQVSVFNILNNHQVTKVVSVNPTAANFDLQFFPEGGNLINGVNSKVAFKAVGSNGLGIAIKGTIEDDKNNTITTFSSQHLGMGIFQLLPISGINYKAHVICADGSEKNVELPKAIDKGYALAIDMDDPHVIKLKISAGRQALIEDRGDTLSIIAQVAGRVYFAAKSSPRTRVFTASIPRSRFPSGIAQFALFSPGGEPLNERLVFIQNPDLLKLDISTEKQVYSPRQQVKISLNAQNKEVKPVVGSFSVSVTDETIAPIDESCGSSIQADLLLISDLRGYVEQPNYYFDNPNKETKASLDVLMLTQGYHRFEWRQVLNNSFPAITYQPEKALEITGRITTATGTPVGHSKITLISRQKSLSMLDTVTDASGNFKFDNLNFADSITFDLIASDSKGNKNVKIEIDDPKLQNANQKIFQDIVVNNSPGSEHYFNNSRTLYNLQGKHDLTKNTILLKEVHIKNTRARLEHSSNLNGAGNADQVLTGDQIPAGFPNLPSALAGRLVGVKLVGGRFLSTRGIGYELSVIMDGVEVPPNEMNDINPYDIASIEVLRNASSFAIYGARAGAGGVIVITSKTNADYNKVFLHGSAPGMISFSPIGYYKRKSFYSPLYGDPKIKTAIADLRSTIYWNPNVITGKDGKATFEYFNAGRKGLYKVVVEGIDDEGNIGRQVFRYKVE